MRRVTVFGESILLGRTSCSMEELPPALSQTKTPGVNFLVTRSSWRAIEAQLMA
jgi:hypothetical protein